MGLSVRGAGADRVEAATQPVCPRKSAAPQASNLLGPGALNLMAEGDQLGAAAGSLSPAPALAERINGNEAEQIKAGEQFRRLIEPIISPERYPELHARFERKNDLLEHLARENGMSARNLRRKLKRWQAKGNNGLTRKFRSDKDTSRVLNDAAQEFILRAALPEPHSNGALSTREIFRYYEEERLWRANHVEKLLCPTDRAKYRRYISADGRLLASAQLSKASYSTFCRQVAQIPEPVKTMARQGEEAYRNAELIIHRDLASMQVYDAVVFDHRLLDLFSLIREGRGWKLCRPWLTAAIDSRSRKWLGWCFVETPSSDSIATVLRQIFVKFGLPKSVYFDRGKDFRAQWLAGRKLETRAIAAIDGLPAKWNGVLDSLGVRITSALAYNARAKLIEPNFNNIANFDKTLPEYCGHKPGARPERLDKLLKEHEAWVSGERESTPFRTIEEVAKLYTDFIEHDLNERPHSGEGMRKVLPQGMGWYCPNEVWELGIARVPRRSVPEEILQLCFCKRRETTIRNGEVHATFGGRQYHYRFEGSRLGLLALNGRKVELGYDPQDVGQGAIYLDGEFCGLVRCIELRRVSEDRFVEDIRDQRAGRREMKRYVAAVHQAVPFPDAETHLARRRAVVPARVPAERPEAPAQIPAAIAAAHAAREAERASSLESVTVLRVERRPEPEDSGDFNFFGHAANHGTEEREIPVERRPEAEPEGELDCFQTGGLVE